MTRGVAVFFLVCLWLPHPVVADTAANLSSRINIDGIVLDFVGDEWVLDDSTTFSEPVADSRWGLDNDVIAIAATWDNTHLYLAIRANTGATTLTLYLDTTCGGVENLYDVVDFRRNIEFAGTTPNVLVNAHRSASDVTAAVIDCVTPINLLDRATYQSVYAQGSGGGALELAFPWELLGGFETTGTATTVPHDAQVLRIVAAVTGGPGTGAGDAAPNSSVTMENDSTRLAVLDNYVELPLDANNDGNLDLGVSPRAIATYGIPQSQNTRQALPIRLDIEKKVFAPDNGETLKFRAVLDPPDYGLPVYLTAKIYSAAGQLMRNLFNNKPRDLSSGGATWDDWDGRDDAGSIVPGGVYVLAVSGGPGKTVPTGMAKTSFAVIR